MSKITIELAKLAYRVVDNPYMVKLNKRTVVVENKDEVPGFSKYTFSLIPLDKLEQYKNKTDRFITFYPFKSLFLSSLLKLH
jgi:replication factor A1